MDCFGGLYLAYICTHTCVVCTKTTEEVGEGEVCGSGGKFVRALCVMITRPF